MNTVRVNGYAKLNLTLDVVGREDGFHMLDSLAVTIGLFDRVVLKRRRDPVSTVRMHGMGSEGIPPECNNALLAAEAFSKAFGTNGADITVYKNIPMGAGLGGSSADAAAVLRGMGRLYGTDTAAVEALSGNLGSDTKGLFTGGLVRMRGRGTEVEKLELSPALHFLVICPREGVSSKECYAEFDRLALTYPPVTERALSFLRTGDIATAARYFSNHLYDAAKKCSVYVENAYLAAKGFSPLGAAMTGSGAAAFALFETQELAAWARSRYRGGDRVFTVDALYPRWKNSVKSPYVLSEDEGEGESHGRKNP